MSGYICEGQHGFRPGYKCENQGVKIYQDIADSLDDEVRTEAIILELSKVFDLVPHDKLIYSLLFKNIKINIHKNTILPAILYGCETWSLTLREKLKLKVSENRVLRRVLGPKRGKVIGEWRN